MQYKCIYLLIATHIRHYERQRSTYYRLKKKKREKKTDDDHDGGMEAMTYDGSGGVDTLRFFFLVCAFVCLIF